jgi:hypothetical protein
VLLVAEAPVPATIGFGWNWSPSPWIVAKWKFPLIYIRSTTCINFRYFNGRKCIKWTSNSSFNQAFSSGGFLKESHQEYTELCRRFTIEEWSRFRGGFLLTVLFVRRTIISERLYFCFVKFYIYIRLWLIVLLAPIVCIKILLVYMYWSCHIFAC